MQILPSCASSATSGTCDQMVKTEFEIGGRNLYYRTYGPQKSVAVNALELGFGTFSYLQPPGLAC